MAEKKIECPKCWVPLDVVKEDIWGPDIDIDVCPKCNGIWLDPGELKKILKNKDLSDYLTKDIGTKSHSPLICPGCRNIMDIQKADDIETDVCLTCHGVWLDPGELDDLKAKARTGFEGDEDAKALEKYETMEYKQRNRKVNGFFKKLLG